MYSGAAAAGRTGRSLIVQLPFSLRAQDVNAAFNQSCRAAL